MDESLFVMISALQHFVFCPRQCALIHLEQLWEENEHTAEGILMHEKAHSGETIIRGGIKIVTDVPLQNRRLGLTGKADIVEFHKEGTHWQPYPVEYKKGSPKQRSDADEVQLCGQALCLEEMLGTHIPEGALFYGTTKRRKTVLFNNALRERTEEVALAVTAMLEKGDTPPPKILPCCEACSLQKYCIPRAVAHRKTASSYIAALCEGEV